LSKRICTTLTILVVVSLAVGATTGREISIERQEPLFESLLGIATIVFGIMGAWVAIVYPDSLKKVFEKRQNISELSNRVQRLFLPLRVSVIVVSICC